MIAEYQNIVYYEYLPTVLNEDSMKKHHLNLEKDSVYYELVNPTVRNEFSTVAFRFGHSQVQVTKTKYYHTLYHTLHIYNSHAKFIALTLSSTFLYVRK